MARPITQITDSFKVFKDNVNTISLNVGDPDLLNTEGDSDLVQAINELDSDINGAGGGTPSTDLTHYSHQDSVGTRNLVGIINAIDGFIGDSAGILPTTATTIIRAIKELDSDLHGAGGGNAAADMDTEATTVVGAINEIEAVFDASDTNITSPSNFEAIITGDFTVDATGDIILDADDADIILKDGGVERIKYTLGTTNTVTVTENYTVDASGDIVFDADGANITFKDDGTDRFAFTMGATNDLTVTGNFETNVTGSILDSAGTSYVLVAGTSVSETAGTTHTITAGTSISQTSGSTFTQTSGGNFTTNVTGDYTVDASNDIILDADNGNLYIKDGGVTRFQFIMGSNQEIDVPTGDLTVDVAGDIFLQTNSDFKIQLNGADAVTFTLGGSNQTVTYVGGFTEFTTGNHTQTIGGAQTANVTGNITQSAGGNFTRNVDGNLTDSATGNHTLFVGGTSTITVEDSSTTTVAGDYTVNVTGGNHTINVTTGDFTVDASGDVVLDVDDADVLLKDGGTQYAGFTNSGGHLVIKTSTDTALTFDSTNATFSKTLYTDSALGTDAKSVAGGINELETAVRGTGSNYTLNTTASNLVAAINEHETDIGTMSLNTTASNLTAAINEHETDIGNMTFTGLSATDISAAIRELRTELGDHTALTTDTTTSAILAINEVDGNIDSVVANTIGTEDITSISGSNNTVKGALVQIHTEIGSLSSLDTYFNGFDTTHITALNALAADVEQLQDSAGAIDGRVGPLSALSSYFDSAGATASIVSALNHVGRRAIDVYDASGTLLNA